MAPRALKTAIAFVAEHWPADADARHRLVAIAMPRSHTGRAIAFVAKHSPGGVGARHRLVADALAGPQAADR